MSGTLIKKSLFAILILSLGMFVLMGCGSNASSDDNSQEQTTASESGSEEQAAEAEVSFEDVANENTRFLENGNITARVQIPTKEGWRVWPTDPSDPLSYATLYYNPNNEYEGDNSPKVEIRINEAGPASARLEEITDSGFATIGDLAFDYRKFTVANGMEAYDFIHDITDEYTVYIYIQGFDIEDPDLVDLLYSIRFKID